MIGRPILPLIVSSPRPVATRFWAKVDRRGPDECWPWKGATFKNGYGAIRIAGHGVVASRVAWALARGTEPANGMVCHHCDNPPCCNPAHLFLGTQVSNMGDMHAKGRWQAKNAAKGEGHHRSRLSEAEASYIKASARRGADLAREFGISPSTVCAIRNGRNWAWLKPADHPPSLFNRGVGG